MAQAAMRHADSSLTSNVYTDPKLLDVAGALDALPTLPLHGPDEDRMGATGTLPAANPSLALTPCKPMNHWSFLTKHKPSPQPRSGRLGLSQVGILSRLKMS